MQTRLSGWSSVGPTIVVLAMLAGIAPGESTERTLRVAAARDGRVDPREGGLEVGMGEWAVSVEADVIRPGPVTFVVRNGGARTHGFRIRSSSRGRGRDRFESRTRLIPPGGAAELTVSLPDGRYEVDCYVEEPGVGEHDGLGMEAVLVVRADAPLVPLKAETAPSAVSIERFAFSPATVTVKAGSAVAWENRDPVEHTVTGENGAFESGLLAAGARFSRVFDAPGTFPYTCRLHPSMKGQVEVEP